MRRSSSQFSIPPPSGRDGYIGRECPKCNSYFKIVNGTGLPGTTHCYCPYCGWKSDHSNFHTRSQIEYAQSVVVNSFTSDILKSFKKIERKSKRQAQRNRGFLNLTFEVKGRPEPIRYPRDFNLETYVDCTNCTLKYAVYGVYAYCPDCGKRNVHQILDKNLDTAEKILRMGVQEDGTLREALIGNALTSVVAALDGYGREVCRAFAPKSVSPDKAQSIRFQNLERAQTRMKDMFGFDIASSIPPLDWETAQRSFQKRHLLEHRSGVVDEEYLDRANDASARLGRKISLSASEVEELIDIVRNLGKHIFSEMETLP